MSKAHTSSSKLLLAVTALAVVQLACFTSKKTVIIQSDGSGQVFTAVAFPQTLGAGITRADITENLTTEGWTNVSFSTRLNDNPGCALSAEAQTEAVAAFEALMPALTQANCAGCHGEITDPHLEGTNHPGEVLSAGQTCSECHVQADAAGPGSWRLAPPELAFVDRTAAQICTQIKRFHAGPNGFIAHLEGDRLVGFGFNGVSAGAAAEMHPPTISGGDALILATAWRDALGIGADARYWPAGRASDCGCAPVDPVSLAASGVLEAVTAEYPFDLVSPETTGAAVNEFTAVEYTAVDQSDGSVVYSFAATADVTEIQTAWGETVNVWAVEGVNLGEIELGELGGLFPGAGAFTAAGTFTAADVQAMIAAYGEPLVEVVIVLPGEVTQAAVGWSNSEELLAGASDSARFTWRPGDPSVTELSLVRVARPPSPDSAGEQRSIDPDAVFEFAMALPWSFPALDSQTPGEIAEAALNGNTPPSALTQLATLRVLDTARRSGDLAVYNQLDGLAYAPVRLSGLDHKAVVVFPSGTDWKTTGVILDPWIAAFPAGVPIDAWAGSIWIGAEAGMAEPEIDPALDELYPHAGGGDPVYPPDVQRDDALPQPPAALFTRSLFARGPVSVLVILPDGRHIGETPGGGFISHLRGEAEMFKRSSETGLFDWWTFLPETGYRVEIHALEAGTLQVTVGGSGFDIADLRPGELLAFTVAADGTPGPVVRSGGEEIAEAVIEPEVLPIPEVPEIPEEPGNQEQSGSYPLIGGLACMVVLGLALMIVSGIGLARRRRAG